MSEPSVPEWSDTRQTTNEDSRRSLVTFIGIARRFATDKVKLEMPLLKMTPTEAGKLGAAMRARKPKPFASSIFVATRSFFAFHEMTKQAKAFKVSKKTARMSPDKILTTEEVNAMIGSAGNLRDRAMLAVLADTGIRIHEACALKLRDVKTETHSNGQDVTFVKLWIGKTKTLGEERSVLLGPEASEIILGFVKQYPADIKGGQERPLFPSHSSNHYGGHTNPNSWIERVKDIATKAGVTKHVHPHLFRHYMATRLLRAGWTEPMVKARGGWAPGSTVMSLYSHLVDADVDNETLARNGFVAQKVRVEPIVVPTSKVPSMPPQWTPGNINVEAMVEKKLREIVAQGGLIVKPGGAVDLAADDGGLGD